MAAQYARPWRKIADDLRDRILEGRWQPDDRLPTESQLAERYKVTRGTIRRATDLLQKEGLVRKKVGSGIYVLEQEPSMPEPASNPEHQPVVAAIVTSHKGVLAGRRHDGTPLWTFIAGEIEPGESAVDAAVREVKEETGLEVRAGYQEIGRRVHPKTKRTMIYLACTPVAGTDVFVGDEEELAEVRWLSLAEVDTLLPGVFEPVREHLGRLIS
jgi:8-oxo-dGTP pyrophosphatase MutT (NUDIX family)